MPDYSEEEKEINASIRKSIPMGLIGVTIVFLALVVLGFKCSYRIGPGFAGVVYNVNGGIEGETLGQGWHIILPWKSVTEYPVSTETVYYQQESHGKDSKSRDDSVDANTKDGKKLNLNITYAYHMDQARLPELFTKFRGQHYNALEKGIMKNLMMNSIAEVTSQYNLLDVTGDKLPEVNAKIFENFRKVLEEDGILLETFTLVPNPDEQTKEAIQKVLDAQNALVQARVEKEKAEVEAEQARVTAQGKADAALIEAKAQAEANRLLQESLTREIIENKKAEKWDGKLPQYMLGESGASVLISPGN
ncbi:MAG: hypothetical protein IJR38_01125 [Selenomonadaceae bacterium]|nr:hypothetical protein [Selenomonadaceae bacterium]